eukprot:GFUD01028880.1.p1 GENE.GFUD01028880.1~~GFUD01028880.1.p1  ORF type:complete len:378 (-),score=120.00 GFUD01028880.1:109-1242(-)
MSVRRIPVALLLAILIPSPSTALPVKDDISPVIYGVFTVGQGLSDSLNALEEGNLGTASIKTITNTGLQLAELIKNVKDATIGEYLKKLDTLLEAVNEKQIILNANHTTWAAKNIGLFVNAKVKLQASRNVLNVLAQRTANAVEDLREYNKAIFGGEIDPEVLKYYVKKATAAMKKLIKETDKEIDAVKIIYKEVGETFGEIKENVKTYERFLTAFKKNETMIVESFETKTDIARGITYSILTTSTVSCIFVDISLTFGLCSAINAGVVAGVVGTTEIALATLLPGLPAALDAAEEVLVDVQKILEQNEDFQTYLGKETLAVKRWELALDAVEDRLNNSTKQIYFSDKFAVERKNFERALDKLEDAAEDYLAQSELL